MVAFCTVTVAGLNQLGAPFFVEPLFNGAMLILAVGLAVTASRRRIMTGTKADAALQTAASPAPAVGEAGSHPGTGPGTGPGSAGGAGR